MKNRGIPHPLTFYRKCHRLAPSRFDKRGTVTDSATDLRQGTLDMLILKAVSLEPLHGWGIAQRIQEVSKEVLQVNQGSLYPALHRLERRGLIDSAWAPSDNNRRSKYYRLTRAGRSELMREQQDWDRFMIAVQQVMQSA